MDYCLSLCIFYSCCHTLLIPNATTPQLAPCNSAGRAPCLTCRAAVGSSIHATLAVGHSEVADLAGELGEDASWLNEQQQQQQHTGVEQQPPEVAPEQQQLPHQSDTTQKQQQQQQQQSGGPTPSLMATREWQLPPPGAGKAWRHAMPLMVQVCCSLVLVGAASCYCTCCCTTCRSTHNVNTCATHLVGEC